MQNRKVLVVLCDGMADEPLEKLGNRTPLEYVCPKNMNKIASDGFVGMSRTVPDGMNPGSDTANLSIFGYNPEIYFTGRAPLEAISMGIELGKKDAAFRCNFVNISNNVMHDFTAGHIDTKYSEKIISLLNEKKPYPDIEFHTGVSYRNAMIWRNYPNEDLPETIPPHDIQDRDVFDYYPKGSGADVLKDISGLVNDIVGDIDAEGLKGKPTHGWLWGGGFKPQLKSFSELYGLSGYTISAVDLIHGIGRAAGLEPMYVEGATGYIDTNYIGKAKAAIEGLKERDFVYLHFESPDESGHEGNIDHKIKSIKDIDEIALEYILKEIQQFDDYTIILLPDHPTPIHLKTHTSNPVPFAIKSTMDFKLPDTYEKISIYSEKSASNSKIILDDASLILGKVIERDFS